MRLAVVSDVHGNLTALEAVIASLRADHADVVVHAGDVVVTGARPAEVIDRMQDLGWAGTLGNTDEMLWNPSGKREQEARAPKIVDWLAVLFDILGPWAKSRLGKERLEWLRSLPPELNIDQIRVMHASPHNRWRAPMPDAPDQELSDTYGDLGAGVVVYGHIHRPFVRNLGLFTVVNCGSVGLPYDDDWRPSYALIDEGAIAIRRVEYDLQAEQRAIRQADFPFTDWLIEVQRRGRFLRPR